MKSIIINTEYFSLRLYVIWPWFWWSQPSLSRQHSSSNKYKGNSCRYEECET
jgi:hypothetical protein